MPPQRHAPRIAGADSRIGPGCPQEISPSNPVAILARAADAPIFADMHRDLIYPAIGMVGGLVIGLVIGWLTGDYFFADTSVGIGVGVVIGAGLGSLIGAIVSS